MSHIQDLWFKEVPDPYDPDRKIKVKTTLHGTGMRYKVRWEKPDGREGTKSFPDRQKTAAERFKKTLDADLLQGQYMDPQAGRKPFMPVIQQWIKTTSPDPASRTVVEGRINNHVLPFFEKRSVGQACTADAVVDYLEWLSGRGIDGHTQGLVFGHVVKIMDLAVKKKLAPENPCRDDGIRTPKGSRKLIIPWSQGRVNLIWAALPDRNQIVVPMGAGLGMRLGEMLGFSPDDIRRRDMMVDVQRQIRYVGKQPVFSLPKGNKTRQVPLAKEALDDFDAHMECFEPMELTLPWRVPDGRPETVVVLMAREDKQPWYTNNFRSVVWDGAFRAAGVSKRTRVDGPHALRHYFASTALADGVSIRELAEYLGHHDASVTLRYYAHLMPSSHDRARSAIGSALAGIRAAGGTTS